MRTPQGAIVVGVDGSPLALDAVDWAYREAGLRNRPVHLVTGVILDLYETLLPPADEGAMVAKAVEALNDAVARKPEDLDVPVTRQVFGQAPARLLVDASEVADLVVVGTRGHGGFAGMLLGSVSQHVSRHAHCDVAVIRPVADHARNDVVAGVDMSHRDAAVLRAAFEQARRREAMLRVVHTWPTVVPAGPGLGVGPVGYDIDDRRRGHQEQLDQLLQTWQLDYPDVNVAPEAQAGHPASVLADESQRASLLVVGARGGGAFAGLLLGSTTSSLLHHAHCPVLIAR